VYAGTAFSSEPRRKAWSWDTRPEQECGSYVQGVNDMSKMNREGTDRRDFLRGVTASDAALMLEAKLGESLARAATPDWKAQVGLPPYTIRDVMTPGQPFEDALAKIDGTCISPAINRRSVPEPAPPGTYKAHSRAK